LGYSARTNTTPKKRNAGVLKVLSKAEQGDLSEAIPVETDAQLVRKAQKDREAFGLLYERYVRKIYTYIYYRTGHPEEAEDLTSKVFQKAQLHLPRYRDQGLPFSSWLYRIAHNMVANWYRDHSRRKMVGLEEAASYIGGELTSRTTEEEEERGRLLRAIRLLSDDKQQLLILKYSEEYSNAEIGKIMGRSEGAIKSLFHRILVVLREELEKEESQ
jgi:RNA polymerase sigma-70 factor, ECF subfamily